jgi:hypothetical protein
MRVFVLCILMRKAHADRDWCEAMHAFLKVYVGLCKAHGQ